MRTLPRVECDEPVDGGEIFPGGVVSGWAYAPVGILGVAVWLDGVELGPADHSLDRADVAGAHPDWPGALRSGFRFRLPFALPPASDESHDLVIMAEDWLGRRSWVGRRVRIENHAPIVAAAVLDLPRMRRPGDPLDGAGWSSPLVVEGWAVDPAGVNRIDVLLDGEVVAEGEHGLPREDVEAQHREYRQLGLAGSSGWVAVVPTDRFPPGEHEVEAVIEGRSGTLRVGPVQVRLQAENARTDPERQARIDGVLCCPSCRSCFARTGGRLSCGGCGREVPTSSFGTLLFDETYAGLDWRRAIGTSQDYPLEAADVIDACRDGLVLEIGAGLHETLPHVVQLDAIAFPNTDVSANAESLPFADESFDGVIACALLEHVSSPWKVVAEARRVCKIGGRIYADFTSVHPYHGFPHHYFNATETGLDWLMREAGGAEGTTTPADPLVTIRLVLESWLGSLDEPGAREAVESMEVGDVLAILASPARDPARMAMMRRIFPNGRRLIPPKVVFVGVRSR